MRTINEMHLSRLLAEAEEADLIGQVKIAENITRQLEKVAVRENSAGYSYSKEDFKQDIQEHLWSAIIRTADFHGTHLESKKAQEIVEFYAEKLISDIRISAGLSVVGAYEGLLPGEFREVTILEVE